MPTNDKFCVIVPSYNEESNISSTIKDLKIHAPDLKIIVINDASTDGTSEIARQEGCLVLDLVVNLGIGGAVQTGYKWAINNGYKVVIQFDGDGQHEASSISKLISVYRQEKSEIVIGSRYLGLGSKSTSRAREFGTKFLNLVLNLYFPRIKITDATSGFRLISGPALNYFADIYAADYPEPISLAHAAANEYKITEVPVRMNPRVGGKSSIRLLHAPLYMFRVLSYITLIRLAKGIDK